MSYVDLNFVSGFRELQMKLRQLPIEMQKKIEKRGLRRALEIVKASAEARTPVDRSGGSFSFGDKPLADSFRLSVRAARRAGGIKGYLVNIAPHAHLIEYGWIFTSHKGKKIKRIPANPFLMPALEDQAEAAIQRIFESTMEAIQKFEDRGRL